MNLFTNFLKTVYAFISHLTQLFHANIQKVSFQLYFFFFLIISVFVLFFSGNCFVYKYGSYWFNIRNKQKNTYNCQMSSLVCKSWTIVWILTLKMKSGRNNSLALTWKRSVFGRLFLLRFVFYIYSYNDFLNYRVAVITLTSIYYFFVVYSRCRRSKTNSSNDFTKYFCKRPKQNG